MKYVINPWIIYAIAKFDAILIVAISGIILCAILIPVLWVIKDESDNEEKYNNIIKKSIIVLIISIIIACICPTTKTATEMLVASYVTDTNIENTKEEVIEMIDYITEKVNEEK
jgi:branched-subunit amino acid permease